MKCKTSWYCCLPFLLSFACSKGSQDPTLIDGSVIDGSMDASNAGDANTNPDATRFGCQTSYLAYYPDCDGDGYGTVGSLPVQSCGPPASKPTMCPTGAWTTDTNRLSDCADRDPRAHPDDVDFQVDTVVGKGGFDFNCDGIETKLYPDVAEPWIGRQFGNCSSSGFQQGWAISPLAPATLVPDCGQSSQWARGLFFVGATPFSGICHAILESRTQACR